MFTVILLGPDVIAALHLVDPNVCLVKFSSLLGTREARPCIVLLHYLNRNPLCLQQVCPTSIYCNSASLLYTLCTVLGPSQSSKVTMGSGLVQANINNLPSSSNGRNKQRLRNGLLGYSKVHSFEIHCDKCAHRNSLDQSNSLRERAK